MSDHGERGSRQTTGSISSIPTEVCLTLLMGAGVGWVAFVPSDGVQELMPANFTVVDDVIYFRTSDRGALSPLGDGLDNVAFGVNGVDSASGQGWNVTARGESARVTEPELLRIVEASGLRHPWAGGDRGEVIGIVINHLDGRRVARVWPASS